MSLAGIPATAAAAMAGAESGAAGFSGLSSEGVATGPAGSVAADGQALRVGPVAVGPDATGGGPGATGTSAAGGQVGQFLLSPAVTVGARIVMGVAMAFMLLILI